MGLETHYRVILSGDVVEGYDVEEVKEKLVALFKTEPARIEHVFNGKTVSIKKDVDYVTAQRYCDGLQKLGAICRIIPMQQCQDDALPQQDQVFELKQTISWIGPLFLNGASASDSGKRHLE